MYQNINIKLNKIGESADPWGRLKSLTCLQGPKVTPDLHAYKQAISTIKKHHNGNSLLFQIYSGKNDSLKSRVKKGESQECWRKG